MRLHISRFVSLLGLFTVCAVVGGDASGLRQRNKAGGGKERTLFTLPLIPHRARYPNGDDESNSEENENLRRNYRRRRRRRRRQRALQDRPLQGDDPDADDTSKLSDYVVSDKNGDNKQEEEPKSMDDDLTDALYRGYGTHYVDLWVGTPPQRQTVIIDTGSSVTAFPCMDCVNCGEDFHTDVYFQEDRSSSFHDVDCQHCRLGECKGLVSPLCELSVAYQEGSSWNAYEVMDTVYSGGLHDQALESPKDSFEMRFGCQTHVTGLFKTQLADGIMGMEMAPSSFWKQWHDAFRQEDEDLPQRFSLCFTQNDHKEISREGTPAGMMIMGGTHPKLLHNTTMVFAEQQNHQDNGWFVVKMRAIYFRTGGGTSVVPIKESNEDNATSVEYHKLDASPSVLNNGEIILDSGTTDTYLSTKIGHAFKKLWKDLTGTDFNNNAHYLEDEYVMGLPTILFQLEGSHYDGSTGLSSEPAADVDPDHPGDVLVAMPPNHYMEYSPKSRKYTARIYLTESHGGVLGANFILGHNVLFDVDNHRVGFAESDCNYQRVYAAQQGQ